MPSTLTRKALLAGAAGAVAGIATADATAARADEAPIQAVYRQGTLPVRNPLSRVWREAKPATVPLLAQQMATPFLRRAGVKSARVRAMHNGSELAFLIQWSDRKANDLQGIGRFEDAVAIQLPWRASKTPPPFTMGGPGQRVHIVQWRASWQRDLEHPGGFAGRVAALYPRAHRDLPPQGVLPPEVAKLWTPGYALDNPISALRHPSAVDEVVAAGFGSATSLPEGGARGFGRRTAGGWAVTIGVPLKRAGGASSIRPGTVWPVALAVWLGADRNRGSRKHWATWTDCHVVPA